MTSTMTPTCLTTTASTLPGATCQFPLFPYFLAKCLQRIHAEGAVDGGLHRGEHMARSLPEENGRRRYELHAFTFMGTRASEAGKQRDTKFRIQASSLNTLPWGRQALPNDNAPRNWNGGRAVGAQKQRSSSNKDARTSLTKKLEIDLG